jgi:hypothetical protein
MVLRHRRINDNQHLDGDAPKAARQARVGIGENDENFTDMPFFVLVCSNLDFRE